MIVPSFHNSKKMVRSNNNSKCIAEERSNVYSYALELTLDAELADDITQDVMLHALEQPNSIKQDELLARLKQWTKELADTHCAGKKFMHLGGSRHDTPIDELDVTDFGLPYEMVTQDIRAELQACMPDAYQSVLCMRSSGLTYKEIAEILRVTPCRAIYMGKKAKTIMLQGLIAQLAA